MPEERLDVRLARENEITRSRAETLIRQGQAQVNGCVETKPGCKVKESDSVSVIIPPPVAAEAQPEDLPLEILYEDGDLAVVVKPCGMVVHPAAGNEDGQIHLCSHDVFSPAPGANSGSKRPPTVFPSITNNKNGTASGQNVPEMPQ